MKTALLIDVNNFHFTIRNVHPNKNLDYKKYLASLREAEYEIVLQEAYGKNLQIVDSFKDALLALDFSVYYGSGKPPFHHCDVDIAMRAVELLSTDIRCIIIGSGKPSMLACIKYLKRYSDKRIVVSSFAIHNSLQKIADGVQLINEDDLFERRVEE